MKNTFIILMLCILVCSCEYQFGKDYFKEIEKPKVTNIQGIDFVAFTDGKQILVNKQGNIIYNIPRLEKMPFSFAVFTFKNSSFEKKIEIKEKSGVLSFEENIIPAGTYELNCVIYYKTNSGSIGDQLKSEYWINYYKYPIKIDYQGPSLPTPTHQVKEDGTLEIKWDEPRIVNMRVKQYHIKEYHNSLESNSYLSHSTSAIIDDYVGQASEYKIMAEAVSESGFTAMVDLGAITTTECFDIWKADSDLENVTIQWRKFKHAIVKVSKSYGDQTQYPSDNNKLTFPIPAFSSKNYEDALTFKVFSDKNPDKEILLKTYFIPCIGEPIFVSDACVTMDKQNNRLCAFGHNMKLVSYQLPGITKLKEGKLYDYTRAITTSKKGDYVAVNTTVSDQIEILNGNTLETLFTINTGTTRIASMQFCEDSKLVYFSNPGNSTVTMNVYDCVTQKLYYSTEIPLPTALCNFSISEDGKNLVVIGQHYQTYLYTLTDYRYTNQRSVVADGYYSYFNPLNPNQVFLYKHSSGGEYIDVRNFNTWTKEKTVQVPDAATILGFDPITGNIIAIGENKVIVYSMLENKTIFTCRAKRTSFELFGNFILSNDGYLLDFTRYLQ